MLEQQTQDNKITKVTNKQDVKYKTQEFKGFDKETTELTSDTTSTELAVVMEYFGKTKDRSIAKPEIYEERTKRRNAEIEGLKQALQMLNCNAFGDLSETPRRSCTRRKSSTQSASLVTLLEAWAPPETPEQIFE